MRKDEFFRHLEYLLQDVPEADREEAMNYYRDYLEEAGPENEAEVLREFGSPERIASIIRSDHIGNLEDGGSFTERGYEDERFREPNYQLVKRMEAPEEQTETDSGRAKDQNQTGNRENGSYDAETYAGEKSKKRSSGCLKAALALILLATAGPALLGAGGAAVGISIGILTAIAVVLFSLAIVTLAFLVSGVALVGAGIAVLWSEPMEALMSIGIGLFVLGLGLLALVVSVWFYGKLVPRIFRGIGGIIDAVSDRIRRRL